jgi:hypothetical protein
MITGIPRRKVRNMMSRFWMLTMLGLTFALSTRAGAQGIPAGQFEKLHKMIKPQDGESRFQEIPWLLSIWEARQKAAEEGKPLLVWAGAGGAPTAVC